MRDIQRLWMVALAAVWLVVGCTESGSSDSTRQTDEITGLEHQAVVELWGTPDTVWQQDGKMIVEVSSTELADFDRERVALDYRSRQVRVWFDGGVVDRIRPLGDGTERTPPSVKKFGPED